MHPVDHTKNIIELEHISFAYTEEEVLHDINLNIHQGDFLGVIGPNGGGKTTLLKIMLGLLKPSTGSVRLFGQDLREFRDWKRIGYVPQKATNFDPNFPATVKEIVAMGRYAQRGLFHFLTKRDYEIVDKALNQVEMRPYQDRIIGDLSGGQQQRVFIARALASEPEVILLDEPTVGVDKRTLEDFYALMTKLNVELSLTLVLISHDIDVVASQATEVAWINRRLIYYGPPDEFVKENRVADLYGEGVRILRHEH
jgi:zinc transport system ATP-binding protein